MLSFGAIGRSFSPPPNGMSKLDGIPRLLSDMDPRTLSSLFPLEVFFAVILKYQVTLPNPSSRRDPDSAIHFDAGLERML